MNTLNEITGIAEQVAVLLGVLIAFFAVVRTISAAVSFLLSRYRAWVIRRSIKGLLLTPTTEEIARFSVKIPQKRDLDEIEFHRRIFISQKISKEREIQYVEGRIIILSVIFLLLFGILAIRFLYIATLPIGPDGILIQ